jgi:hypothetical protein
MVWQVVHGSVHVVSHHLWRLERRQFILQCKRSVSDGIRFVFIVVVPCLDNVEKIDKSA